MSEGKQKPRYRISFITFGESYLRSLEGKFKTYKQFCEQYYVKIHVDKGTHNIYTFITKL